MQVWRLGLGIAVELQSFTRSVAIVLSRGRE